jgi:hypothetical protein
MFEEFIEKGISLYQNGRIWMNGHYNYIMQHMIIFLIACLLAVYCQEEYQIKVNNFACSKQFQPYFLNFTSASYGPSLQDTELLLVPLF